ncbi:MAG: hypothetical protein QMD50_03105 [Patescibacteria group bacterium]|nr:hypothetical protein [Patescibacteria group bacterium]
MENIEITCNRCHSIIAHHCNLKLKKSIINLLKFVVTSAPPRGFKSSGGYSKGDENAPLFSEAYLYNLFGKEDGRTILALINDIVTAAGYDMYNIEKQKG